MTIDFTKPVRTRSGYPVRILCTDGPDQTYPIVGYLGRQTNILSWAKSGRFDEHHLSSNDLVQAPEPINFDLPVQTRSGLRVRIFCVETSSPKPVIGIIEGQNTISHWYLDGTCWSDSPGSVDDLVQAPGPHPEGYYLNVYRDRLPIRHETREQADKQADEGRLACIFVIEKE